MLTKYYSELTHKYYDSVLACTEAERNFRDEQLRAAAEEKKKAEAAQLKEKRRHEIKNARQAVEDAQRKYVDLCAKYDDDYPEDDLLSEEMGDAFNRLARSLNNLLADFDEE